MTLFGIIMFWLVAIGLVAKILVISINYYPREIPKWADVFDALFYLVWFSLGLITIFGSIK